MRRRRATVATPGEWLAVANGPNIFQMLLVIIINIILIIQNHINLCHALLPTALARVKYNRLHPSVHSSISTLTDGTFDLDLLHV